MDQPFPPLWFVAATPGSMQLHIENVFLPAFGVTTAIAPDSRMGFPYRLTGTQEYGDQNFEI